MNHTLQKTKPEKGRKLELPPPYQTPTLSSKKVVKILLEGNSELGKP